MSEPEALRSAWSRARAVLAFFASFLTRPPAPAQQPFQREEPRWHEWGAESADPRFPGFHGWPGAVLLNDEITYYCEHSELRPLIFPFDRKYLKPARYQLRLGPEARVAGQLVQITPDKPLTIEPHQVAIVRSLEELNIPHFLIARWNLRIDMVYKGLLWVGALQVDPGWVGYLPCPLYNMSSQPVVLNYDEKVFTIDFVRTTAFDPARCKSYSQDEPPNPRISIYDPNRLQSGPYDALRELREVRDGSRAIDARTNAAIATLFTALGAVIAALGVIVARPITPSDGVLLDRWPLAALVASLFSAVFSVAAWFRAGRRR